MRARTSSPPACEYVGGGPCAPHPAPLTICIPPARLLPAVRAPSRAVPRKTRSTPELTLVLELVSWEDWGVGWGL